MKLMRKAKNSSPILTIPRLNLVVQYRTNLPDMPGRPRLRRWTTAALQLRAPDSRAEITLRLVDETEGRALNSQYRNKDYATNVLSFGYDASWEGGLLMGDLVLCVPVVCHEAAEQRKQANAHYAHLVVHGMLHLQGYDHEDETAAQRMETLEKKIIMKLGYANPYEQGLAVNTVDH